MAMSQGGNMGLVDIEESHSFSLRGYNQVASNKNLENSIGRQGEVHSGLSNYSRIKAE